MRVRPAAVVAVAFAGGILLYAWLEPTVWTVVALGFGAAAIACHGVWRRTWWAAGGAVLVTGCLGVGRTLLDDLSAPNNLRYARFDNVVALTGRIADDPDVRRGSTLFRLEVDSARTRDGTLMSASGLVQVRWGRRDDQGTLRYGQRIELSGRLESAEPRRGGTVASYTNYLRASGIRAVFYSAEDIRPIVLQANGGNRLLGLAYALRRRLKDSFERNLEKDNLPLALGVCFGTQAYLPLEVRENFAVSGTVHILSASGMHVAVIASVLSWVLMGFGIRKRRAALTSVTAVALYAVMAGLSPPIVRAGLMFAICSMAHLFKRAPDWPSGLYVSAIVILGVHPYALFDIGFQLSYICVLSLFYLRGLYSPAIDRVRILLAPKGRGVPRSWRAALAMLQLGARRAPQGALRMAGRQAAQKLAVGVLEVVLASAAVQIGTLPAIVYYFGQTQWLGVAANVVIVPLSSAVLILSAFGAATTPLVPSIGGLSYAAADWAATRTMATAKLFAGIPGAGYSVGTAPPAFIVLYYGLLIWAVRRQGARNSDADRGRREYEEAAMASGPA